MEEPSARRNWIKRNRNFLIICTIGILIVIFFTPFIPWVLGFLNTQDPNQNMEVTHRITFWITPEEEEFIICLDFYYSESDLYENVHKFTGYDFRIDPGDDGVRHCSLFDQQEDLIYIWAKIYFDDNDTIYTVERLEVERITTAFLLGREITLLFEMYQEEPVCLDGIETNFVLQQ